MKFNTKKIVISSMFAALCCVATMIVKIPSPLKGYINLGDCIVLLSGWLLSPWYGFAAAATGSALADVLSGYLIYAPATFVIKGFMAVTAGRLKRSGRIISGCIAEVLMILGYFIFEGFLYGFAPSVMNIPANAVQGAVGVILGIILLRVFEKTKMF